MPIVSVVPLTSPLPSATTSIVVSACVAIPLLVVNESLVALNRGYGVESHLVACSCSKAAALPTVAMRKSKAGFCSAAAAALLAYSGFAQNRKMVDFSLNFINFEWFWCVFRWFWAVFISFLKVHPAGFDAFWLGKNRLPCVAGTRQLLEIEMDLGTTWDHVVDEEASNRETMVAAKSMPTHTPKAIARARTIASDSCSATSTVFMSITSSNFCTTTKASLQVCWKVCAELGLLGEGIPNEASYC